MVLYGDFQGLAERIVEDLRFSDVTFRERPHEQIEVRSIIKMVEKEWFVRLWLDETGKDARTDGDAESHIDRGKRMVLLPASYACISSASI